MANVLFAARTAATTTLNVVSGAASMVNEGVNALTDLASVASAHSRAYREATEHDIKENADLRSIAGSQEARIAIAERLVSIQKRLDADPALNAMYLKVGAELQELRAKPVAA